MKKLFFILVGTLTYSFCTAQDFLKCLGEQKPFILNHCKGVYKLHKSSPHFISFIVGEKDTLSFGFDKTTGHCKGIQFCTPTPYSILPEDMMAMKKWESVSYGNYKDDNFSLSTHTEESVRYYFYKRIKNL